MNDSTDLAMTMRDRAGWTGTDPGVSVLLINGAKALEEAEREVAELREAAQAIVTGYFDGDFRPSDRERLICVLRDLLRKCRPMVARSMMSSYRDAAPRRDAGRCAASDRQGALWQHSGNRERETMSELRGCTDGNCIIRKPEGMHTNGGCGCERELRHALGLQDSRRFIHALRERQREVAELRETLLDLAYSADTAELLLKQWCPGEAASLRQRVTRAKALLKPHAQGTSQERE